MNPTREPGDTVPRTDIPAAPTAVCDVLSETDGTVEEAATGQEVTVTETVVTTLGGMVVGSAALWFLAPICFTC